MKKPQFKLTEIQLKLLLNVAQIFMVIFICWKFYWMLIYDTLYWEKTYFFLRYVQDWMFIVLAVIGLAFILAAREHPEIFARLLREGSEPQKKKKKQTPRKKTKEKKEQKPKQPLW